MTNGIKEKRFLDALGSLFTGMPNPKPLSAKSYSTNFIPSFPATSAKAVPSTSAICRRTADTIIITDGTTEKINPATMSAKEQRHFISLIKPHLWWGK